MAGWPARVEEEHLRAAAVERRKVVAAEQLDHHSSRVSSLGWHWGLTFISLSEGRKPLKKRRGIVSDRENKEYLEALS